TSLACAGNVEVGAAKPDDSSDTDEQAEGSIDDQEQDQQEQDDDGVDEPETPVEEPDPSTDEPEEVDCSEADATARAPYEAWQATDNQFGVLAGKTLSGYIEGGPDLLLTIAEDQTATLLVGVAPPPPEKDGSYLCENEFEDDYYACEMAYTRPPVPGGSYPVYGATLENSRLQIPLQQFSPWDAWCALQQPHEQVQPNRCFFTTITNDGFSISSEWCTLNNQPVDCGWLALAQGGICSCTSTECFAAMAGTGELLDARLNDAETELVGSFRGATVYLFVEEE
ncbi:MAG TPA: hypothetical protein VFU02_06150, partial [Polyangiaceae bacterium]|nr:hypothetical protein [Polyangiaceae bacterium]